MNPTGLWDLGQLVMLQNHMWGKKPSFCNTPKEKESGAEGRGGTHMHTLALAPGEPQHRRDGTDHPAGHVPP